MPDGKDWRWRPCEARKAHFLHRQAWAAQRRPSPLPILYILPDHLCRQEQQLGELVVGCTRLCELRTDLWLPASAGMPGLAAVAAGGPGAAAAAALLISLMYASRDVRAIRAQVSFRVSFRVYVTWGLPVVRLTPMRKSVGRNTTVRHTLTT